jgi:hypothetical protein
MTADPWALLREARNLIHTTLYIDALREWARESDDGEPSLDDSLRHLRAAIDAALAERQDSATPVVEWRLGDDCDEEFVYYEAYPDSDTGLDVVRFKGGKWRWTMSREQQGFCDTLDEAKEAAIAAARGMK